MPQRFDIETTWRASGNGVFQFTSPGNATLPYGRAYVTVRGKGTDGSSPYQTPGTTPFQTPGQTPFTTPGTTPFQQPTPATTPFTTPGQTPFQTPGTTPFQQPRSEEHTSELQSH